MESHFAFPILDVRYANSRPTRACESTFARSVRELEEPSHLYTGAATIKKQSLLMHLGLCRSESMRNW